jgi:hypothetical protein
VSGGEPVLFLSHDGASINGQRLAHRSCRLPATTATRPFRL